MSSSKNRIYLSIAAVVVFLLFLDFITAKPRVDRESVEYTLAYIYKEGNLTDSDPSIDQFRKLLSVLEERTGTPENEIADLTVHMKNYLRDDYGVSTNILELMEGVNTMLEGHTAKLNYKESIALLVSAMVAASN